MTQKPLIMLQVRQAQTQDFQVGTTLYTKEGHTLTIQSHYDGTQYEARGDRGVKVVCSGEAHTYFVLSEEKVDVSQGMKGWFYDRTPKSFEVVKTKKKIKARFENGQENWLTPENCVIKN